MDSSFAMGNLLRKYLNDFIVLLDLDAVTLLNVNESAVSVEPVDESGICVPSMK